MTQSDFIRKIIVPNLDKNSNEFLLNNRKFYIIDSRISQYGFPTIKETTNEFLVLNDTIIDITNGQDITDKIGLIGLSDKNNYRFMLRTDQFIGHENSSFDIFKETIYYQEIMRLYKLTEFLNYV